VVSAARFPSVLRDLMCRACRETLSAGDMPRLALFFGNIALCAFTTVSYNWFGRFGAAGPSVFRNMPEKCAQARPRRPCA
jgi:hypothetical protein